MSGRNNIVIIGGTACGPKAAARARRCDPHARITIVEQSSNLSTATCGLPYYVSGLIENEGDLVARAPGYYQEVMDLQVHPCTRAVAINRADHAVSLLDLISGSASTLEYDKLVVATGSKPAMPDLPGSSLQGIFTFTRIKDANGIREMIRERQIRKAVIVGAGLIGLEMAEALAARGLEVTILEALDRALPKLLDPEIAAYLEKHLRDKGVRLLAGQPVMAFEGNQWVHEVVSRDARLEADLVVMALGAKPNVGLARECGLALGSTGGVAVNEHLLTNDLDIYAGGDCVENVNRVSGKAVLAPLGSTANKHGRVIGTNVTGGSETFPGVLGTAIAKVFDCNVGRVGLSESEARHAGFEVVACLVPGYEYATYYPNGQEILVKLVAEKATNRLLGGQVIGPGETAKRIDVLATALSFGATVDDLAGLDLAYAPPYNSALDPLHNAANLIRNKRDGYAKTLTPMDVKDRVDRGDDFVWLDVRSPGEWDNAHIDVPQGRLMPLRELRTKLDSIPRDAEILVSCQTSVRAYQAQRILDGAGFRNVRFMEASLVGWPYAMSGTRPVSSDEVARLMAIAP